MGYPAAMPLYRVHFTWKNREMELQARSLDLTHPYFVSIKDILIPEAPRIIIDPSQEEMRKTFGGARHLMIPVQTVQLIEELPDEPPGPVRLRSFSLIEGGDPGKGGAGKGADSGGDSAKKKGKPGRKGSHPKNSGS